MNSTRIQAGIVSGIDLQLLSSYKRHRKTQADVPTGLMGAGRRQAGEHRHRWSSEMQIRKRLSYATRAEEPGNGWGWEPITVDGEQVQLLRPRPPHSRWSGGGIHTSEDKKEPDMFSQSLRQCRLASDSESDDFEQISGTRWSEQPLIIFITADWQSGSENTRMPLTEAELSTQGHSKLCGFFFCSTLKPKADVSSVFKKLC